MDLFKKVPCFRVSALCFPGEKKLFLGPDLPSPCPASCVGGIQVEDLYRNGMEHAQDPILEDAPFSRLVYSQERGGESIKARNTL